MGPKRVLVVGSLNRDLIVYCDRRPGPGETLAGTAFAMAPGGKGANQALAAARLGGHVSLLGRVGEDAFGERLLGSLREAGVDTRSVARTVGVSTGVALIIVDGNGENSIVIVPGANSLLTPNDVAAGANLFREAGAVLLQLEVPLQTVVAAARAAAAAGARVLLDPAPVPGGPLPRELLQLADVLLPNQHEAGVLAGRAVPDLAAAWDVADDLLDLGPRAVVLKVGAQGAIVAANGRCDHVPGLEVPAVDTTGAGDAFAGALGVALVEGLDLLDGVAFANRAAALSVTRRGAQPSMPTRHEVDRLAGARDRYEPPEDAVRSS